MTPSKSVVSERSEDVPSGGSGSVAKENERANRQERLVQSEP